MPVSEHRLPARFDPDSWNEDMRRTTEVGRAVAEHAKRSYARRGIHLTELRPCQPEGRDGADLPNCAKIYLPPPNGRFGMVLSIDRAAGRPVLVYVAFGARHHPRGSNAATVYQLAHRRLHCQGRLRS